MAVAGRSLFHPLRWQLGHPRRDPLLRMALELYNVSVIQTFKIIRCLVRRNGADDFSCARRAHCTPLTRREVPDETQSPSFFTNVPMLPLSVVGDRAGKSTTACAGQSLAGDARVTERASVEGACTSADAMEAAVAAGAATEQQRSSMSKSIAPVTYLGMT